MTVKNAGMVAGALVNGSFDRTGSDNVGKMARDGFVVEHLEIAAYEMLEHVADRAGDDENAAAARRNKADEQEMASTIAAAWDLAVDLSLKAEVVEGAPPIPPPQPSRRPRPHTQKDRGLRSTRSEGQRGGPLVLPATSSLLIG